MGPCEHLSLCSLLVCSFQKASHRKVRSLKYSTLKTRGLSFLICPFGWLLSAEPPCTHRWVTEFLSEETELRVGKVPSSHFQTDMYLPRKFLHPPAVAPRTQLPWWMVTSHLWAVLSSRASGVRLQISTLSKCTLKSSNFILSKKHGKEKVAIRFCERMPSRSIYPPEPRARSAVHVL